jgi:hypothetical protein
MLLLQPCQPCCTIVSVNMIFVGIKNTFFLDPQKTNVHVSYVQVMNVLVEKIIQSSSHKFLEVYNNNTVLY